MLADYLLGAWVIVGIMASGIAICRHFFPLRGLELIGFGTAIGVVVHGLAGLAIGVFPHLGRPLAVLTIFGQLLSIYVVFRRHLATEILTPLDRPVRIAVLLWIAFISNCILFTHLPVQLRTPLPDGPYVIKEPWVNVKLQQLTELPTDNYIPFVVTEYLLRGLSFKKEHPILPGEEVTNRTILMSLVTVPFRAALSQPRKVESLGTFHYAGQDWPDVRKLFRTDYYRQSLIVGIVLNSLLLLGILVLIAPFAGSVALPIAMVLAMTSTHLISQTIFIWPKSFAGFFIVLSLHSALRQWRPAVAAACLAVAYQCHPYALVFVLGLGIYYLARSWRERSLRLSVEFAVVAVGLILPWLIWKHQVLRLPSDILIENLWVRGTHQLPTALNFLWARVHNAFRLFSPFFLVTYPFNLPAIVHEYWACLPGAAGIILIVPGVVAVARSLGPGLWWCGLALPGALLIGCFSNPAIVSIEGYQPIAGLLIFFGVVWIRSNCSTALFASLCSFQLAMNLAMMIAHGAVNGARL